MSGEILTLLRAMGVFGLDILFATILILLLCRSDRKLPARWEWLFPLKGRWLWVFLVTLTAVLHLSTGVGMLLVLRNRP